MKPQVGDKIPVKGILPTPEQLEKLARKSTRNTAKG